MRRVFGMPEAGRRQTIYNEANISRILVPIRDNRRLKEDDSTENRLIFVS
jgi:hypothetical protein